MTRIDHAAKAHRLSKLAAEATTNEYATALYTGAQAEATLALVEQQRIANLIALTHVDGIATVKQAEGALYEPKSDGDYGIDLSLHVDIAAALGIGDDQ